MIKKLIVVLGIVLLSACANGMFLGMPWDNVVNVDEYLTQNPDRKYFVQDAQNGVIVQGMNYVEIEIAVDSIDGELVIQKRDGVYGNFSGAYWIVGYYRSSSYDSTKSTFHSRFVVFFENGIVTGWLEL